MFVVDYVTMVVDFGKQKWHSTSNVQGQRNIARDVYILQTIEG